MSSISDIFFNSLPEYFHINDSQKDSEGKGILQRYLSVFQEKSEEYKVDIDGLSDLAFTNTTEDQYLVLIGNFLGNPFKMTQDSDDYRTLLKNVLKIYPYKGTEEGLNRLAGLFGVNLTIDIRDNDPTVYDDSHFYDNERTFDSSCTFCGRITVHFNDPEEKFLPLFDEGSHITFEEFILGLLDAMMPVGSLLQSFYYNEGSEIAIGGTSPAPIL